MISVALVLLLMIGVSQVFSLTGEAVSAGQTLADNMRSDRAAQGVFFRDVTNTASDGAFMLLRSRPLAAFLNPADELSDRDGLVGTADFNGDGTETPSAAAVYSHRAHRSDIFTFFARDFYRRQTGNDGTFVADVASTEALIWYGHLWLPDNAGTHTTDTLPGAGTAATNPNNRHASQWVLGRVAILLREPVGGLITDRAGTPQVYHNRPAGISVTEGGLRPLAFSSPTNQGQSQVVLVHSRYDLAGTSISGFNTILREFLATPSPIATSWWEQFSLGAGSVTTGAVARFQADPFLQVPPSSADVAKQAPLFVPHCSKFIVEYAGDYLNQDIDPLSPSYGAITGNAFVAPNVTDGEIDFFIHPDTGERRIRWYGLPRNVDTSDDLPTGPMIAAGSPGGPPSRDVVPLRDFLGAPAPFEKNMGTTMPPASGNYAITMLPTNSYTCAWGPDDRRPRMIRITMMIEDPSNRLPVGQSFEYIFSLP